MKSTTYWNKLLNKLHCNIVTSSSIKAETNLKIDSITNPQTFRNLMFSNVGGET